VASIKALGANSLSLIENAFHWVCVAFSFVAAFSGNAAFSFVAVAHRYNRNTDQIGNTCERPRPRAALRLLAQVAKEPVRAAALQEAVKLYGHSSTGRSRLVQAASSATFKNLSVEIPRELFNLCHTASQITSSAVSAIFEDDDDGIGDTVIDMTCDVDCD
jgi:hypothetical protein